MYVEVTRYVLCGKKRIFQRTTDVYVHMCRSFIEDYISWTKNDQHLQKDRIS